MREGLSSSTWTRQERLCSLTPKPSVLGVKELSRVCKKSITKYVLSLTYIKIQGWQQYIDLLLKHLPMCVTKRIRLQNKFYYNVTTAQVLNSAKVHRTFDSERTHTVRKRHKLSRLLGTTRKNGSKFGKQVWGEKMTDWKKMRSCLDQNWILTLDSFVGHKFLTLPHSVSHIICIYFQYCLFMNLQVCW